MASVNRIELSDLKPQDSEVIISYRWMKYLCAAPEVCLQSRVFLDDPGGFICLKNPPSRVVIYTSYRRVFSDWQRIFALFK